MKMLLAIAAGALAATAAGASPPSAADPEVSAFACQLGGDCGGADASASDTPSAAPAAGVPRAAAVRGFTFRRTAPTGNASAPATAATASAGVSARASTMAAAPVASAIMARGSADLRLSFPSGSSALDDADRARLAKLAAALSLPRLAGRRLRIEGHTDSKGSSAANLDLSRRRAQAVADCLGSNGVGTDRLEVVGYGSAKPLAGHVSNDGANRRVMAVMLD